MTSTIKVDTIQNSGGTTGLTIDSGGRVLMPSHPVFFAYNTGNTTLTQSDGGPRKLTTEGTWTVDINRGSIFSSGVFTAPIAGIYQINASLTYSGSGTNPPDGWGICLFKNGSQYTDTEVAYTEGVTNGNEGHSALTIYMDLAASDTIEMGYVGTNQQIIFFYWHMGGHLIA